MEQAKAICEQKDACSLLEAAASQKGAPLKEREYEDGAMGKKLSLSRCRIWTAGFQAESASDLGPVQEQPASHQPSWVLKVCKVVDWKVVAEKLKSCPPPGKLRNQLGK